MGMALSFNNNRQCSALYQLSNQSAETTLFKIKRIDSLTLMFVYDPKSTLIYIYIHYKHVCPQINLKLYRSATSMYAHKSTLNYIDPLQACMPPNQP